MNAPIVRCSIYNTSIVTYLNMSEIRTLYYHKTGLLGLCRLCGEKAQKNVERDRIKVRSYMDFEIELQTYFGLQLQRIHHIYTQISCVKIVVK